MNITIIGSGKVGRALGAAWRKAGHAVTFATRDPGGAKAHELAQQGFAVVALDRRAGTANVIVLAVPWEAVAPALSAIGPLSAKVLVDCTDPLADPRQLAVGFNDSGGETVARLSGGAHVVKAFSTTGAANMADSRYPGAKLMMAIAGDDALSKATVASLAAEIGFDPLDTGPLTMCRYLEPLAMLWINLAYTQKLGPNIGFALLRR